jgi:hypothetical protein
MDPTEEIQMYNVWSRRGFSKVAGLLALLAAAVPSRAQDDGRRVTPSSARTPG